MKRVLCLVLAGLLICTGSALAAKKKKKKSKNLEKRSYYDLFGNSLNARYKLLWLTDINGTSGGSSVLEDKVEGFYAQQSSKINYSDKYKKIKATFNLGFHFYDDSWYGTDLFNTKLTPLTFNKVWFPGFKGTLKTKQHNATLLFSRTSGMYIYDTTNQGNDPPFTYMIALSDQYKLKLDGIKLTLSGVYLHHWKDAGVIDETSYFGDIASDAPTSITLRFSDDSISDGAGAKLYSFLYSIDGGVYVDVSPGTPQEANGAAIFEWPAAGITVPASAKSVKIKMELANDYKVEAKSDKVTTYATILRSPGNIQDESNRRVVVYEYGLSSANDMFGVAASGKVYGTSVDAEFIFNNQYRKYPAGGGGRSYDMFPALYVKAERAIDFTGLKLIDDKLTVGGDYFYTHPSFSSPYWDPTSNSFDGFTYVDDNDDFDWYVDGQGAGSGGTTGSEVPLYHMAYDRDSDNMGDWEQDLFLFTADPPRFWVGDDRNNNITVDKYEDDPYPDYPYRLDRHGYGVYVTYPLLGDLDLKGGYDYFTEAFGPKRTKNVYLISEYSSKISDVGEIKFHHTIKRAQDDIADDQTELKDEQNVVVVGTDNLDFQNSLFNAFYVESTYTGFKGVTVSNKFRFDNNYQYDDDRHVRWAGFITNAAYAHKTTEQLTITPQWKCWLEKGFSFPSKTLYSLNKQVNAFLLRADFKLFNKTMVTGGVQYKLVRLPLDTSNEYNRWTFVFQITSKAGSYPLLIGYERNVNYMIRDPSSNSKDETTFLKIYMTK